MLRWTCDEPPQMVTDRDQWSCAWNGDRSTSGRGAASVEICALLRKPDAAKVEVPVKYIGFDIPNDFVVGYGLDYAEKYRNLRAVAVLAPHVYS